MIYGGHFDADKKKDEIKKLEEESNKSDFWNNRDTANEIIEKINNLKKIIEPLEELKEEITSNLEMLKLLEMESDDSLLTSIADDIKNISKKLESVRLL